MVNADSMLEKPPFRSIGACSKQGTSIALHDCRSPEIEES